MAFFATFLWLYPVHKKCGFAIPCTRLLLQQNKKKAINSKTGRLSSFSFFLVFATRRCCRGHFLRKAELFVLYYSGTTIDLAIFSIYYILVDGHNCRSLHVVKICEQIKILQVAFERLMYRMCRCTFESHINSFLIPRT